MKIRAALLFLIVAFMPGCHPPAALVRTEKKISHELGMQKGTFALAFKDLTTGDQLLIRENEVFHAASTMKTPVMIEVFNQAEAGKFKLSDSLLIKNEFHSLVDGSPFHLNPAGDSEQGLYALVGKKRPLTELVYVMITRSSNLATNLIMEKVGAENVTETMRDLGASGIHVLRGVEDSLAYAKGLNNVTTARALMVIFEKLALGETVSPGASKQMIDVLLDQRFAEVIPARLPKDVRVAHKTGSLTGVRHDSGIVFVPGGHNYVLVILSRELVDDAAATAAMARVSELIYHFVIATKK